MLLLIPEEKFEYRLDPIGWIAAQCTKCECIQPFGVYRKRKLRFGSAGHVVETDLWPVKVCSFCGDDSRAGEEEALRGVSDWQTTDGLQSLVDSTMPEAGEVVERSERSHAELRSLLCGLTRDVRRLPHNTTKAGLLGGLTTAVGFALCGWLLYHAGYPILDLEPSGQFVFLFSLGFIAGAVVGTRRCKLRLRHQAFLRVLRKAIACHGLSVQQLLDVASQSRGGLGMARVILDGARHDPAILEDEPQEKDD